jgi:hypothetical protein
MDMDTAVATMADMAIEDTMAGERKRGLLSPTLWLNLQLTQMPTMDMDTVVDTMAGTAGEDTMAGERKRGLLWLSLTPLLNLNLTDMDIAPMVTTGPMGTGAGEGRRDLQRPAMDLDVSCAVLQIKIVK